jgi:hypothetical protein
MGAWGLVDYGDEVLQAKSPLMKAEVSEAVVKSGEGRFPVEEPAESELGVPGRTGLEKTIRSII